PGGGPERGEGDDRGLAGHRREEPVEGREQVHEKVDPPGVGDTEDPVLQLLCQGQQPVDGVDHASSPSKVPGCRPGGTGHLGRLLPARSPRAERASGPVGRARWRCRPRLVDGAGTGDQLALASALLASGAELSVRVTSSARAWVIDSRSITSEIGSREPSPPRREKVSSPSRPSPSASTTISSPTWT